MSMHVDWTQTECAAACFLQTL